jgi:hypothetical protein
MLYFHLLFLEFQLSGKTKEYTGKTAKAVYRNNVKSTPFMAQRIETPKKYQIS